MTKRHFILVSLDWEERLTYSISTMSPLEILAVIGFVIALIGLVITTLNWFGIRPQPLIGYFLVKKTVISRYTYLVIAYLLTLYFVFVFVYFPLALGIFDLKWAVLLGVVTYSMIGIWLPILERQRFWSARLNRTILFTSQLLATLVLFGFWIVSWPDWLVPLILTSFIITALLVSYIIRHPHRRTSNNSIKCWCRHCKTELEPSHTGPCPSCGKTGKDCRVVVKTTIGIRTGITARHKRKGFRKFMAEMVSRWRPSKSPELPNGVQEDRVIDKGRDEYHHIVRDARTGEVIHEEHETLSEHKNHSGGKD